MPTPRLMYVLLSYVLLTGLAACAAVGSPATHRHRSTGPSRSGDPAERAAWIAAKLSPEDLVGQMLMPFAYGTDATRVGASARSANRSRYGVDTAADLVKRYRIGGLILVRQSDDQTGATNPTSNVDTPAQVRRLTGGLQRAAAALPAAKRAGEPVPMLLATDQEHGVVTRIRDGMTLLPTGMGFGAAHDPALTEQGWEMAGVELAAVGLNIDLAPDADVI